jgi:hypothetical protein
VSAKLAAAIVKVQAALENVTKDATNPHFRSQYASLPHILDTVRPVLAAHGLAIVQWPCSGDDGRIGIRTTILHESGESMEREFYVRPQKDDPQGAGSALTYCRRYALAAVLNIGQDDDDGEAASKPASPRERPQPRAVPNETPPPPAPRSGNVISDAQRKRIYALAYKAAEAAGLKRDIAEGTVRDVVERHGYGSSTEIERGDYDSVCSEIETLLRGMGEPKPAADSVF